MSNEAIRFWSVAGVSFAVAYLAVFVRPAPAFPGLVIVTTPLILALILGPMAEENYRRAMVMSDGSHAIFLRSPIAGALLLAAGLIPIVLAVRRRRMAR